MCSLHSARVCTCVQYTCMSEIKIAGATPHPQSQSTSQLQFHIPTYCTSTLNEVNYSMSVSTRQLTCSKSLLRFEKEVKLQHHLSDLPQAFLRLWNNCSRTENMCMYMYGQYLKYYIYRCTNTHIYTYTCVYTHVVSPQSPVQ